jgi:uncharacterized membrane protein YcaP (DUF421 family)
MFDLETPILELVARAAIVFVTLLILVRLSGKRTVGEFTPFDLLVVILIGESAQAGLTGDESSIWGTVIVAATLFALNLLAAVAAARNKGALRLLEGEPVLLARRGRVMEKALRSNHVPRGDLDEAVRQANLKSLEEVEFATLETSGEITIVPLRRSGA